MADKIHVADVGTKFIIIVMAGSVVLPLNTAISLTFVFGKPDGTYIERTGVLHTDGTDGKTRYVTVDGDLDQPGRWKMQAIVEFSNGTWHTDIDRFRVYPNIIT